MKIAIFVIHLLLIFCNVYSKNITSQEKTPYLFKSEFLSDSEMNTFLKTINESLLELNKSKKYFFKAILMDKNFKSIIESKYALKYSLKDIDKLKDNNLPHFEIVKNKLLITFNITKAKKLIYSINRIDLDKGKLDYNYTIVNKKISLFQNFIIKNAKAKDKVEEFTNASSTRVFVDPSLMSNPFLNSFSKYGVEKSKTGLANVVLSPLKWMLNKKDFGLYSGTKKTVKDIVTGAIDIPVGILSTVVGTSLISPYLISKNRLNKFKRKKIRKYLSRCCDRKIENLTNTLFYNIKNLNNEIVHCMNNNSEGYFEICYEKVLSTYKIDDEYIPNNYCQKLLDSEEDCKIKIKKYLNCMYKKFNPTFWLKNYQKLQK